MSQPRQTKQTRDVLTVEPDVGALRLVNLNTGKASALAVGVPTTLEGALRLTVADGDGNAMLERTAKGASGAVAVDGAAVFEIAHFRPMQLIETESGLYVMLRPYDLFLRRDTAPDERLARWQQLLARARLKDLAAAPSPTPGKARKRRGARPTSASHGTNWRLLGMTAAISIAATFAWLKSGGIATSGTAPDEMQEVVPPQVEESVPKAAESPAEAAPPSAVRPAESEPAAPAVSTPAPAVAAPVVPPAPAPLPTPPAPPSATPQPTATKSKAPAITAPAPQAAAKTSRKMDAADERRARQRLDALLLESNYDPHGARRQLEALSRTVINGSEIHRDIRQAINSIQ